MKVSEFLFSGFFVATLFVLLAQVPDNRPDVQLAQSAENYGSFVVAQYQRSVQPGMDMIEDGATAYASAEALANIMPAAGDETPADEAAQ